MAPIAVPLSPRRAASSGIALRPHESAFRENSATIVLPSAEVAFLNPVQEFNRDLSVVAIRTWSELLDSEKRARWEAGRKRAEDARARGVPKKSRKRRRGDHNAAADGPEPSSAATESLAPRASDELPSGPSTLTEGSAAPIETTSAAGTADSEAAHNHDETTTSTAAEVPALDQSSQQQQQYQNYKFTLLEALSATGLRSIRYAKEIPSLRWVLANDLSPSAVKAMRRNVALNFPPDRPIEELHDTKSTATSAAAATPNVVPDTLDDDALMDLENAALARAAGGMNGQAQVADAPIQKDAIERGGQRKGKGKEDGEGAIHPDCKIRINEGDACTVMYNHRAVQERFDVVDLDPYGTAAPFLDAGVQCVSDGGLLAVTCTDLAVLAGHNYPEKCFANYGGVGCKAEYGHEVALRLVLHAISTSASRYGRYIQPLLSLSIDFYVRVFVRVYSAPVEVKRAASKTGIVYTCHNCQNWHVQHLGRISEHVNEAKGHTNLKYHAGSGPPTGTSCEQCDGKYQAAGPMWIGPLHDPDFCEKMLSHVEADEQRYGTSPRIKGMVSTAAEELEAPFYFTPSKVCGLFHCTSPSLSTVVSALLHADHAVSRSHCSAGSLKTSATRGQVYDVIRSWIQKNPVRMDKVKAGSPSRALLERKAAQEYNLETEHPQAKEVTGGPRLVRYQQNPAPNWGPGTRAKGPDSHRAKGKRKRTAEEGGEEEEEVTDT